SFVTAYIGRALAVAEECSRRKAAPLDLPVRARARRDGSRFTHPLERRLVGAAHAGGRDLLVPTVAGVLGDLGRGPAEIGTARVGDDLDGGAGLPLLGLPRPLLEAAGHDDTGALAQRVDDVLAQGLPGGDVEEGGGLPLLLAGSGDEPVHGDTEV